MSKAETILQQAVAAADAFRTFSQSATDRIVRAVFLRALAERVTLARMAFDETGLGVWEHKVMKNVIATQLVYDSIKDQRTVGVIHDDPTEGIIKVAEPVGPVLAFVPVTNPSSTTLFKILIALKTRNALIISPPQAARHTTAAAAKACYEAALEAGAPEHCIQWLDRPIKSTLDELMASRRLALILATGTTQLVSKAVQSGRPVLGVGPGNVPVYIGSTADVPFAVHNILASKLFDNGSVCASEQAVVVKEEMASVVMEEFRRKGGHFLSPEEAEKVARIAWDPERRTMTATVVGQPAARIAKSAGIAIPEGTRLLLAPQAGVGPEYPLSAEILAPILAFYVEPDFDTAIARCSEITRYGGTGHTAVIYSNTSERIEYFSRAIAAGRILVNVPSTQGALGGMLTTLEPSFMLTCGTGGGNVTMDNITARHLLNVKKIARRRPNPKWLEFECPQYLDPEIPPEEIEARFNRNF
jgi:acetaldehyde dehydrogenase / alcohol dehydrogenase